MRSENSEREEPLRLYATGLAKEAADVLYATTLQLLGAGSAKGPSGVAAALQQLMKHDSLRVRRLPVSLVTSESEMPVCLQAPAVSSSALYDDVRTNKASLCADSSR